MKIKTIYTNLKPKYKLVFYIVIFFTAYILCGLYYPKRYSFSCVGTKYSYATQIIEDPLEPKTAVEDRRGTTEDIIVEKYFFGLFYTLEDFNITQCSQDYDSEIVCKASKDYKIRFNPYKNTFKDEFLYLDKENNVKKQYFSELNCKKDNNSLN